MQGVLNKTGNRFGLTQRESDVLKHLLKGLKNAAIADNLEIAEQTVKDHLGKIYKKLGVENRFELMRSLMKTSHEKLTPLSRNVTEHKETERDLREGSLTDELTGLYNRRGFFMLVEHHLRVAKRYRTDTYMLFAEVDNVKAVNETSGRSGGDSAVRDTANILIGAFRESDIIARVGHDEFAVVPLATSQAAADEMAARLQERLDLFNAKRKREYPLSVSYCISCHKPGSCCSLEELLLRAVKSLARRKKGMEKSVNGEPGAVNGEW